MRRFISIFLCVVLIVSFAVSAFAYDAQLSNIEVNTSQTATNTNMIRIDISSIFSTLKSLSNTVSSSNTLFSTYFPDFLSFLSSISSLSEVHLPAIDSSVSDIYDRVNSLNSLSSSYFPSFDSGISSIDSELDEFHSNYNANFHEFFDYFSVSDNPLTLRMYGRTSPTGTVQIQSVTDHSMMLLARNSADDPALAINTISNDKLSFADRMTAINNNLAYLGTLVSTASTRYKFNVKNYDTGVSSSNTVVSLFDWLYFFNGSLGDQVQRLGYMFAADHDIELKDSTKVDSQWITDYYSGDSRPGTDDYSSVQGSVGAFNGFMSTGSSDNLGDGLAQIDNNGYSFWSSAVDQDINHSVGSGSSGKFSARSSSDGPVVIDFFSDNWRQMGVNEDG